MFKQARGASALDVRITTAASSGEISILSYYATVDTSQS